MIPLPKNPHIEEEGENKATFVIEGLYPGYGTTIGNTLRRILISSLEGAAINKVKIEDVSHEFSTIPGVKEDGIMILLNLKRMKFKMFGDEETIKASLDVKGEKEVTAGDLKLPSQLELVDPDQPIATLTDKDASLQIEIEVGRGIGYEPASKREKESGMGVVDLDAIYSPISKVSFKVEDMMVGKRTDFNRLLLTVETDGRIDPKEAYDQAVDILQRQVGELNFQEPIEEEPTEESTDMEKDPLDIKVSDLDIPSRVAGILEDNRVKSVAGLVARTEENISEMDGVGPKSLEKIKEELAKMDLELK